MECHYGSQPTDKVSDKDKALPHMRWGFFSLFILIIFLGFGVVKCYYKYRAGNSKHNAYSPVLLIE